MPIDVPIFAFCGIGNYNTFIQILNETGLNIVGKQIFRDHQKYNSKVLHNLSLQIENSNCRAVVTTEKDLVKINNYKGEMSLYAVRIKLVFEPETLLNEYLEELIS